MITIVATWRCKCGTRVKVIAETDRAKPTATVIAACPDCGDEQEVYAHRVISVVSEADATTLN
jgi:hypothetical protein